MGSTVQDFQKEIHYILASAKNMGACSIEINSGYLHQRVGGYLSRNSEMSTCRNAMKKAMQPGDRILQDTASRNDPFLVIHYQLPRELR